MSAAVHTSSETETAAEVADIAAILRREGSRKRVGIYGFETVFALVVLGGSLMVRLAASSPDLWKVFHYLTLFWLGHLCPLGCFLIRPNRRQKAAVERAIAVDDIAVLPILIGCVSNTTRVITDKRVEQRVIDAQTRLLLRLTPNDSHLFTKSHREALISRLDYTQYRARLGKKNIESVDYVVAILHAFAQVGTEKEGHALYQMAHLPADDETSVRIKEVARKSLAFLKKRLEEERVGATLLRAAAAPNELNATLLRPVTTDAASHEENLLRPVLGESSRAH